MRVCLNDRRQAWVLGSDGAYTRLRPENELEEAALGTHQVMMNRMRARAGV